MKTKIYIFLLLCFCTTFTSEASLPSQQGEIENHAVVTHTSGTKLQKMKLNFFQKLVLTITGRKKERAETSNDNGLANASVISGVTGLLFLASIAVGGGVAALLSIPLSIIAIVTGAKAQKRNTNYPKKASTGKTLGIVTLVLLALLVVVASISLSQWK